MSFATLWNESPRKAVVRRNRPLVLEALEDRTLLSYSFTLIAETGDRSSYSAVQTGTINQDGTVAFLSTLHSGGQAIIASDGESYRIIAVTSDLVESFVASTPINAQGRVAFRANLRGGGQAILRGDGGPLTRIADSTAKSDLSEIVANPDLNDHGTVVFAANYRDKSGQAILGWEDGKRTEVSHNGTSWAEIQNNARINNNGLVSFRATLVGEGQGIFVNRNGTDDPRIVTDDTLYRDFTAAPPINDAGVVVTVANLWAEGQHFLKHDGEKLQVLETTGKVFSAFGSRCIDNFDRVSVRATLTAGGVGLFAGFDTEKDRVVVTGDELFGSTVTNVTFGGGNSCNDNGQFAFIATLEDGRTVIVRANPDQPSPRPPSLDTWAAETLNLGSWPVLATPAAESLRSPATAAGFLAVEPAADLLLSGASPRPATGGLDLVMSQDDCLTAFPESFVEEMSRLWIA